MTQEMCALLAAAQGGSKEAAGQLLTENSGLMWSVVHRYTGRGVETEDLYQMACIGFLKAIQGFDPAYGTQFSTYAVPKIAGEIRRFLRDDGAVKVSRALKERALAIRRSRDRLSAALGREPTLGELAAETGLEPEEIAAAEPALVCVTSLQAENEEGLSLESTLGDGGMEWAVIEQAALGEALSHLSQRDQLLVRLRYGRGFTQAQTARVIGVSQVQISRLEKKIMGQLRTLLEG